MRKSHLGLLAGLIFLAGQSAAMAADASRCLRRDEREGQDAYVARVHNACDARWRSFVPARPTSDKAYDDYMRRCDKPCAAVLADGAVPSSALLLGAIAVGGAVAVASGGKGGGSPASP